MKREGKDLTSHKHCNHTSLQIVFWKHINVCLFGFDMCVDYLSLVLVNYRDHQGYSLSTMLIQNKVKYYFKAKC